jgi:hypothetical protein
MSDLRLAFGLRDIPADVTSAWGARLIWPNDLVHDRQDLKGPTKGLLAQWLNGGALRVALDNAARLARASELTQSEDREVVLYEDERGVIKANPQASFGYLYVAGWLK